MIRRSNKTHKIYTQAELANTHDNRAQAELDEIKQTLDFYKHTVRTILVLVLIFLVCFGAFLTYEHFIKNRSSPNPVPMSVQRSVNFSIYFPDPNKLPSGYTLDKTSFRASSLAAVYIVNYGKGQRLAFSVQQKPSSEDIQGFYAKHLPLHYNVTTDVGTAAVGAIGSQTFVSLPTNGSSWIIVTGPPTINQTQLKEVLQSIRK